MNSYADLLNNFEWDTGKLITWLDTQNESEESQADKIKAAKIAKEPYLAVTGLNWNARETGLDAVTKVADQLVITRGFQAVQGFKNPYETALFNVFMLLLKSHTKVNQSFHGTTFQAFELQESTIVKPTYSKADSGVYFRVTHRLVFLLNAS